MDRPPLMRWTVERFMALVESGVIPERRGIELVDGQVVTEMPQGDPHFDALKTIQRALAAMGGFDHGMMVGPTIFAGENVFDPEIAFLSPDADRRGGVPHGGVLFVIEVSHTSRAYDLGRKRDAYAEADIPHYWAVDTVKRGIWGFARPVEGVYTEARFVPSGESIEVPLIGAMLDTRPLFPLPVEGTRSV